MSLERHRIEREWLLARDEKAALQNEANVVRRAGRQDPAVQPAPDLLERLQQAKKRCKALEGRYLAVMEMEARTSAA